MGQLAILYSIAAFVVVGILHVILCRVLGSKSSVRWMFVSFAINGAVLCVIWYRLTDDLPFDLGDWITLLAATGFLFLGYMEAFSMLCRGFSLGILVELDQRPGQTIDQLISGYGNGAGVEGLMQKRLLSLQKLGLISVDGSKLSLNSGAGQLISQVTWIYKSVLKLGRGG